MCVRTCVCVDVLRKLTHVCVTVYVRVRACVSESQAIAGNKCPYPKDPCHLDVYRFLDLGAQVCVCVFFFFFCVSCCVCLFVSAFVCVCIVYVCPATWRWGSVCH